MNISIPALSIDRQERIQLLHSIYKNHPYLFQYISEPISFDIIYHASDKQLLKWRINLVRSSDIDEEKDNMPPFKNSSIIKETPGIFTPTNSTTSPKPLRRSSHTRRVVIFIDSDKNQKSNTMGSPKPPPQKSGNGPIGNSPKLPRKQPSNKVFSSGKRKKSATHSKIPRKKPSKTSKKLWSIL